MPPKPHKPAKRIQPTTGPGDRPQSSGGREGPSRFATERQTFERRSRREWEQVLGFVDGSSVGASSRQVGDPELDELFSKLLGHQSTHERRALLQSLVEITEDFGTRTGTWATRLPVDLPSEIRNFRLTLPNDMPDPWLAADSWSSDFWNRERFAIIASWFYASLPASFAAANGARVLAQTGGMASKRDLMRRIPRTGEFIATVMMKRLFDDNGALLEESEVYRATQFIRVLHAAVRHLLLDPTSERPWNVAQHGIPVNQMDLAGTVLAFALVTDEPFERMKGYTSPEGIDEWNFLSRWNTIGSLLGVQSEYLAFNVFDARNLFDAIRIEWTETTPDDAGPDLIRALLEYMNDWLGDLDDINLALFRHMSPFDVPRLLHVHEKSSVSPIAVAAMTSALQEISGRSGLRDEIGTALFEVGFKVAKLRNVLDGLQDPLDQLDGLHFDDVKKQLFNIVIGLNKRVSSL